MGVGKKIKEIRTEQGLSQVDLARILGISKELLYRYESEKITNIPYDRLVEIANALFVEPGVLMGWETDQENGQQKYYLNDETADLAQELHDNPDMHLVFDVCRGAGPEELQRIAEMIKLWRK